MSKTFGNTRALSHVSFEVRAGAVHALAGENGAGKSTLIKILAGVHTDYSGQVRVDGGLLRFSSPRAAVAAGIATIHQELSLVGSMSVADNLALGKPRRLLGLARRNNVRAWARTLLREHRLDVDPDALVEELPLGKRQLIEIARALSQDAKVLILDEPTSALGEQEAAQLFEHLERLRDAGRSIIYISHRMEEIYRVASSITVLRDGQHVLTRKIAELPEAELVAAMVGEQLPQRTQAIESSPPAKQDVPRLEARNLSVESSAGRVDAATLRAFPGEILGLAGLHGSGASTLLSALGGGARGRLQGAIFLDGGEVKLRSPRAAIAQGVIQLASDRNESVLAEMSVLDNAMLSSLRRHSSWGMLRRSRATAMVSQHAKTLKLKTSSVSALATELSGGNQQKVALIRCLLTQPRVLLLDEPTRGIDIGAKADVYRLIRRLATQGVSIVLSSTELEELCGLCHRVVVMTRGRIAAEFVQEDLKRQRLLTAMMGAP